MITPTTNPTAPDPCDAAAWLADKIAQYQAEVDKLEVELKRQKITLRGHQIYLAEVKKKRGEVTP